MLPEKFLERMQEMLGEEFEAFSVSLEKDKYQALRRNQLKPGVMKDYFNLTPVSWEKSGFYYPATDQPGKHPLHEAGVYYIQEPSAMAVVPLLGVTPGDRVLDLCAAPGGKSTQIAGYLQGEGLLVCNEIHPARAKILSENIERMGVKNALVTNETPTRLSEKFVEYFDRVLVDAPCSGEGMFRKNQAACDEWSPENVQLCADRQDEILDLAAGMLRPGGVLVYSTCTFAPMENEGSISRFLERHRNFSILPIDKKAMGLPKGRCDGRAEWAISFGGAQAAMEELSNTLRLWPHVVDGEGHYATVLQKQGASLPEYARLPVGGIERGISPKDKDLEVWWDFWKEVAAKENGHVDYKDFFSKGIFLRFGDQLYFAPENMPCLKGLKVLRPGLHLGTIKKNRLEPSHALALALKQNEVRHACQLDADEKRTSDYLNGQTFSFDGDKGWYLITVDGFSLGWGKLAGGIMKNHYPKGLRKN